MPDWRHHLLASPTSWRSRRPVRKTRRASARMSNIGTSGNMCCRYSAVILRAEITSCCATRCTTGVRSTPLDDPCRPATRWAGLAARCSADEDERPTLPVRSAGAKRRSQRASCPHALYRLGNCAGWSVYLAGSYVPLPSTSARSMAISNSLCNPLAWSEPQPRPQLATASSPIAPPSLVRYPLF